MADEPIPTVVFDHFPPDLDEGSKSILKGLMSGVEDSNCLMAYMIGAALKEKIESKEISDDDHMSKINFQLSAFDLIARTKATWLSKAHTSIFDKNLILDRQDFRLDLLNQAFQDQHLPSSLEAKLQQFNLSLAQAITKTSSNSNSSKFTTQITYYTYDEATKTIKAQIKVYNYEATASTTKTTSDVDKCNIELRLKTVDYDFNQLDFDAANKKSDEISRMWGKIYATRPTVEVEVE